MAISIDEPSHWTSNARSNEIVNTLSKKRQDMNKSNLISVR